MPYTDFGQVLDMLPVTRIRGQDGSVADGSPHLIVVGRIPRSRLGLLEWLAP